MSLVSSGCASEPRCCVLGRADRHDYRRLPASFPPGHPHPRERAHYEKAL